MKKIITKFWGVALIVVLLSTLFVAATPVSAADPLVWNPKTDAPSTIPDLGILTPGTIVQDFDFNGGTMLAATGTGLYLSTFGGTMAANIIARPAAIATDFDTANYVAIAPDDANVMVAVDATSNATDEIGVVISVNGGATWTDMAYPTGTTDVLYGVEISPVVTGGIRYVAVWGRSAATNAPVLYYYNYGSGVGSWINAVNGTDAGDPWLGWTANASDEISSFAFSPNFQSDYIGMAVSSGYAATETIRLHVLSFNSHDWDASLIAAGYPSLLYTNVGALTVNRVDVALPPDFDGSDESLRIAFIGASIADAGAAAELGGVWRYIDNTPAVRIYTTAGINSVDYDGSTLVAGAYASNNVFRSVDPMVTAPTFAGARNLKRIGGSMSGATDAVLVKFDGETLYGSKQGASGAISKSLDSGNTWNDFTMINAGVVPFVIGTIDDIYFTANGDPWYLSVDDNTAISIFRVSMFAAQRVLTVPTSAFPHWLRGIQSEPDLLYVAANGGTTVYATDNGGQTRWQQRNNIPAAIADLAVESEDVIYIGSGVNVYKSINGGFTWGTPVNAKTSPGTIFSMLSLGENELIVGATNGGVTISNDGGTTWTATFASLLFTTNARVAATGLDNGDFIFVGGGASDQVFRCEISPANMFYEFKSMNNPSAGATYGITGLQLIDGVLYASSSNGTFSYLDHTLTPTKLPTHTAGMWSAWVGPTAGAFNIAPQAIKVSHSAVPNDIYVYTVDTIANAISYFQDNVALNTVTLIAPADDVLVQVIAPLTGATEPVNFLWNRLSLATAYELQVSLDDTFDQLVVFAGGNAVNSALDPVSAQRAGFVPGNTYYWRARATAPVMSAWSETRMFTIQPTAASVPVVSSPEIGGTVIAGTTPAFSWSPVAGATMYRFELSTSSDFATTVYATDTAGAGVGLPASITLETGTTYFWRVKALTPVESDWSTVANFIVAEEAVEPPPTTTTIVLPTQEPPTITTFTVPPDVVEKVNPAYIWAIIIIGAVLVIAVIVLIVRTRRSV